jgi:hypothetical protein
MERDVVTDLVDRLPVSRRRRKSIARELRSHLEETRMELIAAGWSPDDAERESEARLGDTDAVLQGFRDVYRPGRARAALGLGLAGALLLGVYGGGSLASATAAHKTTAHTHPALTTAHHRVGR